MFVRVKNVRSRRYTYLVKGVREGKRVRQESLYLGPLAKVAFSGVGDSVKEKAAGRFPIDWKLVNDQIRQIPLRFEEVSEARRRLIAASVSTRRGGIRTQGTLPRADGELAAISRVAEARFRETFKKTGESTYRMR